MDQISILGINGSPRKRGGTVTMMNEALEAARREGAKTKAVHLADYKMKPYHGDYDRKPDRKTLQLFREMMRHDGYIFATPVHWLAPSSLMKILIDNLTYLETPRWELEGKAFGVVAHCWEDGGFQAAAHIASVLDHFGLISPPYSITFRNRNVRKNKDTEWMWKDAALLGKNLVTLCAMLKREKPDWSY